MKILTLSLCLTLFAASSMFAQSKKELKAELQRLTTELNALKQSKEVNLSEQDAKVSYALGVMIATNIKNQEMGTLDIEALKLAFEDVLKDQPLKLQPQEAEGIIQQYMQERMEAKRTSAIEEANAYLEKNKASEGVKETQSGLQYKVLKEGTGKSPGPNSKVTVHYTGMLTDGTVFDSSVERGTPISFGVNQVIPGWTEALKMMKEGGKWKIVVPYDLAYGEQGAGDAIPPFATLVFEVELLKVE